MRAALLRGLLAAAMVIAPACGGDEESGGALAGLARAGDSLKYKATYSYSIPGPLKASVTTTMSIAQRPPDSVRRFETSTRGIDGSPVRVASWSARLDGKRYACSDLGAVSCVLAEGAGVFGYAQVDEVFELARAAPDSFASLSAARSATVAGEPARCFVAHTKTIETPPPATPAPRYVPTTFRLEMCYSGDGILLRAHREALGPVPSGARRLESLLEATSVSRSVTSSDIRLPGPVRSPGALPPGFTPQPSVSPRALGRELPVGADTMALGRSTNREVPG